MTLSELLYSMPARVRAVASQYSAAESRLIRGAACGGEGHVSSAQRPCDLTRRWLSGLLALRRLNHSGTPSPAGGAITTSSNQRRLRSAQDDEPARALARAAKRGGVRGGRSGKGEGERERRAGALDSDSAGSHSTISFYKKTYKDGLFDSSSSSAARVALLHWVHSSLFTRAGHERF